MGAGLTGNLHPLALIAPDNGHRLCSGDMADYRAFRWDSDEDSLVGIKHFETMKLQDLIGYEYQKQELLANTKAFVEDKPANNVLLVKLSVINSHHLIIESTI